MARRKAVTITGFKLWEPIEKKSCTIITTRKDASRWAIWDATLPLLKEALDEADMFDIQRYWQLLEVVADVP